MNWEKYGIEFSGEADDGDTALEAIEQFMPDIVLTDVRMPNMDGITLSQEIRSRYPHIKIVFVSGHDDAEYMKSAMKVSAVDYIFKPVNLQELCSVIERVVADLHAESTERRMMQDMQVKLKESMPLLREKFLMSLISDKVSQPERIRERMDFLGLQLLRAASFWVIVISVDNLADIRETRSEQDWQLLCYAVQHVCQELADHYLNGFIFEYRGEFVGILYVDTGKVSVEENSHNRSAIDNSEERLFLLASDIWLSIPKITHL
ncbi:Protein-glutamate methylesterase/protein-glutamine glutaminase [Paenibacillus allorhizosphaerae]|uniref:Protein-glutamate methylesterase/protein-glutamine glutaminase n=2 Tax=Paenibacillus allorhizosphaerae TaxID=2849866 RepID=A0ABN7TUW7_9BACL|nr:Protein-glutamate methylesterase/protein-glutamine glutaminase [Paenibacillus allorhizosphaerae]